MPESAKPNSSCADLPPELAQHPKYRILRELGRGGMGIVYQARQTGMMDRQVVIKVINRSLIDNAEVLARFRREVKTASQLSHPNIVTAYDAEMAGQLHLLVMEFVPGQNLADVLAAKGPLPVATACHYVRQAARALQHAHERGMVHRDIKPENLMLTPQGQIKVLDFGIAKVVSEQNTCTGLTASNSYVGTPEYSAPEQATDARSADIRADLYSLGCTLYCLLAGRPPFQEATVVKTLMAHLHKEPPPLPQLRPEVPEALWGVVARLLAKEPRQRYQKPNDVVQALAPFVKPGTKPDAKSGPEPTAGEAAKGTVIVGETRRLPSTLREVPGQAPRTAVLAKDAVARLGDLLDSSSPPRRAQETKEATPQVPASSYRLWPMLAGAAVLLLVLLGTWASGVFKVKTKKGTIVLENLPADAEVLVDGKTITLKAGDGKSITISAGEKHQLEVRKEGFKVFGQEVEIDAGGRQVIRVSLQQEVADNKTLSPDPQRDAEDKGFVPSKMNTNDDPEPRPREKQLKDLMAAGSVWKGPFWNGDLALYIQQGSGSTFRAVQAYHRVLDGKVQRFVRSVRGNVTGSSLDYHPTSSDRFRVTGTRENDCLDVTYRRYNGFEVTAKLKREEARPKSASCVLSVFHENDTDGWHTLNHDGTKGATQSIKVDSSKNLRIEHDNFYWLVTNHKPNNKKEWGWHAPHKYHGDHSGIFGRCLIYSICCGQTGKTPRTDWYVVLRGSGMALFLDGTTLEPPPSQNKWKVYCVRLDASAGWKKYPGLKRASNEDIKKVLANVTDLRIKGNYGRYSGGCLGAVEFGVDDPFQKN
ncbi:MAG TPA: protein kinase [Gemmataceae bacterium]|nr:protein kinase [Gemmataceae bacterium]